MIVSQLRRLRPSVFPTTTLVLSSTSPWTRQTTGSTQDDAQSVKTPGLTRSTVLSRWLSGLSLKKDEASDSAEALDKIRNIGISAHIDSGKTTLTERVLFYTGRIQDMHEVRGKDGVGATMDSMELEREKGITIQSAATYCKWKDIDINIIDTPGHVDFTIEVERALRVLDGAILVVCSVGGVQSQTITVDRQMRRYNVPRMCFINKLDRAGARPWSVIEQMRSKLKLNCSAVQFPIGLEDNHQGVVDLINECAFHFDGVKGSAVRISEIPTELKNEVLVKRNELIHEVANVDDELGDLFISEEPITAEALSAAIRRATVARKFVPVFMGSAFKNKGVQVLLDGVQSFLPSPGEVDNVALDVDDNENPIDLKCSADGPLVALAFKLEEGRFGQLTYMRIYSGTMKKGSVLVNTTNKKKVKVPRLVKLHADEMADISVAKAGDIVAMFGVECSSGDTFTDGSVRYAMTSIKVPDPVMSLAVVPKSTQQTAAFSKALQRFQKEDPTFRVGLNPETSETIISGMGELHLDVYIERMKREYKVECDVGKPKVNFREAISARSNFDYIHKKQSGGAGQYGRVVGYLEPLSEEESATEKLKFSNQIIGNAIPPQFIPAIEKGFIEAANSGGLIGHPVQGVHFVLTDGAAHAVDSSELAFKLATVYAFREAFTKSKPVILEPIMDVEITVPVEFQGTVMGDLNRRKGIIQESKQEMDDAVFRARVPLNEMFGYSTALRSMTQGNVSNYTRIQSLSNLYLMDCAHCPGKGEYSMEYGTHSRVPQEVQEQLLNQQKTRNKS